ncbi:ATPase component of ABC transporters [Klebsormidium nitens]|uniref:ATPase component of ABC transporters n=1 Tax=Klebsormidium nitens TaxID=105231 RepID=A0A1Y1ICA3_KLENI|nr:ATPase component of ABC transporters [Klebsormidium nitens]|eukprot:GAQ87059.1 ATPase component of ABC transporters [Klebsormidium nitens]
MEDALKQILGPEQTAALDSTILDYIVQVLQDETFEFGPGGEEAYEAVGSLLVEGGGVKDDREARTVCGQLAERFGGNALKETEVRQLAAPVTMAMPKELEGHTFGAAKGAEVEFSLPADITARDEAKMERRRRKEDRQRQLEYEAHQREAEEALKSLPPMTVWHSSETEGGSGGSRDVRMENFSITVAGKDLISDATVILAYGRRYGLVGRNGTGKTTFLKHMAMRALPGIPKNCQILHVEQEVAGGTDTVLECVLACDVERSQLLKEEAELLAAQKKDDLLAATSKAAGGQPRKAGGRGSAAPAVPGKGIEKTQSAKDTETATRLAEIYKRLEAIDAYAAEARAASILAGLGFTADMQQKTTKEFSGGWRMRVALARALFIEPQLLLLDEPTNHLDLHAVLWLEDYLTKWPKTLVVVSHAREFLNTVVTDILYLQHQKLVTYKGDYDTFEKTRDERLRNQVKAKEANERTRAHIQSFVDKFRYNAKRASLVQSRIKALERIGTVDDVVTDPDYVFQFPTPEDRPQPPIISFVDAAFKYPGGPTLFRNLNFGIDLDSRLAMVGPNGIGKSTLLKLISGELEPTEGTVRRSAKVRMASFSQHHVDGLDLASTPLGYLMKQFPGVPDQRLRAHLGSFGITGPLALQTMYTLSGGQKSRVAFAKITFSRPHILLLDEPSNHLDLDAVEALIAGLALFQGGVLMVSHDQHLISGSVDELWVVHDGTATPFHGTFEEYKRTLVDKLFSKNKK